MQSRESQTNPTLLFSSPKPDFWSKQAEVGRVGGIATVDHAIQDRETALQVPQQRPVHSREITDPCCERLPLRLQPSRLAALKWCGLRGTAGYAARGR